MSVVWTSDGYAPGDFSLWTAVQELTSDRVTNITPPGEVGGGPQSRSQLGKFRINQGDGPVAGSGSGQRAECYITQSAFNGRSCQGSDIWMAWETYFGDPASVADTNAFRPRSNTAWNIFTQWHAPSGGTQPAPMFAIDTRPGSSASSWRFMAQTRGGPKATPTSLVPHDLGAFSYGWHEFKVYIKWGQAGVGRLKVWIDNFDSPGLRLDYTGPIGYTDSTDLCNYLKQGMYRNNGTAPNSSIFHAGIRAGTTEADVGGSGGSGGGSDAVPATNTRTRRFGKATVGSARNGFSANNKRGSKFATGLSGSEEADVKDLHIFIEGYDGTASTQKVTIGIYKDDGSGGGPGTKLGESSAEITVAGNAAGAWVKVSPTTIRVTGANAWLVAGSGTASNTLAYATDPVANALAFNSDTYDASPPRLASPFGAFSLDAKEISICADYDVVAGSSPGGGDTTAPALQEVYTMANGDTIVLGYDEVLNTSSVPNTGDFSLLVNGGSHGINSVTINGSEVQVILASGISEGDTVTLSYTRASGREIEDIAGNLAANFSNQAVENLTVGESVPVRITNIARASSGVRTNNPSGRINSGGGGL